MGGRGPGLVRYRRRASPARLERGTRRVVVLRRLLPGTVALTRSEDGQGDLFRADAGLDGRTPLRPVRESIRFTCRLQEQTP